MKALAFCVVWFLIACPGARGDGGFISPTAFANVRIPDQRALIHFDKGIETLVIDTSFKGDGTNFAWIVPVPSAPKIETATTGLFPTLQTILQPEIIHNVSPWYWWAIGLGAFIFSIYWKLRQGKPISGVLAMWLIGIVLAGMLLPALATAGVSSLAAGDVNVIERKRVGVYDTAVLSPRDGRALLEWLQTNGFAAPTNFLPAIQDYAKQGWLFVASKINLARSLKDPAKPPPLALTFKTERPVYPLRLTGIGNDTCQIDLYVFGPDRAEIPHFVVERCAMPLYQKEEPNIWRVDLSQLRIQHPGLRTIVDQSRVATKLTARLNSQQMIEDAYIAWTPFQEKRRTVYSGHGAAILTANITVPLLVAALLAWFWTLRRTGIGVQRLRKASAIAVPACVLSGALLFLLLPRIAVITQRWPSLRNERLHEQILPAFLEDEAKEKGSTFQPDIAWVRQQLLESSEFRRAFNPEFQTNYFSGQPWREEDSPGNYTLRQTADGLEYVWYDIAGGDHSVPLFRKKE
jgi:hypothetical protein